MSVELQHFLWSAAKAADPQWLLQTAGNAVFLQHLGQHLQFLQGLRKLQRLPLNAVNLEPFLLSVTAAVDQQPLRQTTENAVNSQTCNDLARK